MSCPASEGFVEKAAKSTGRDEAVIRQEVDALIRGSRKEGRGVTKRERPGQTDAEKDASKVSRCN